MVLFAFIQGKEWKRRAWWMEKERQRSGKQAEEYYESWKFGQRQRIDKREKIWSFRNSIHLISSHISVLAKEKMNLFLSPAMKETTAKPTKTISIIPALSRHGLETRLLAVYAPARLITAKCSHQSRRHTFTGNWVLIIRTWARLGLSKALSVHAECKNSLATPIAVLAEMLQNPWNGRAAEAAFSALWKWFTAVT